MSLCGEGGPSHADYKQTKGWFCLCGCTATSVCTPRSRPGARTRVAHFLRQLEHLLLMVRVQAAPSWEHLHGMREPGLRAQTHSQCVTQTDAAHTEPPRHKPQHMFWGSARPMRPASWLFTAAGDSYTQRTSAHKGELSLMVALQCKVIFFICINVCIGT